MARGLLILLVGIGLAGCSATARSLSDADRSDAARLQRIYETVLSSQVDRPLRLQIVATDTFCGYAWPDGRVAVTRGLLRGTTDAELAAALAHEVGHLIVDGHRRSVRTLRGDTGSASAEVAADTAAVELLRGSDVSPQSLHSLLQKVATAATSDTQRDSLHARLSLLPRDAQP